MQLILFIILISIFLTNGPCFSDGDEEYFKDFYTRLKREPIKDWPWEGKKTYLTKINKSSDPLPYYGENHDSMVMVSFQDQDLVSEGQSHIYRLPEKSLEIDLNSFFQEGQSKKSIIVNKKQVALGEAIVDESYISPSHSGAEVIQNIRRGHWKREITWSGNIGPSREQMQQESGALKIRVLYHKKHLLDVKGMAVSYDEATHQTRLFFDICDAHTQTTLNPYQYIEGHHPKEVKTEKVNDLFKIHDGTIWQITEKREKIYTIFQNFENWDINKFSFREAPNFTQNVSLQKNYSRLGNYKEIKVEIPYKILTLVEPEKLFSRLRGPEEIESEYVYSDGKGSFCSLRKFREKWQEENSSSEIALEYLKKADNPVFTFHRNVKFASSSPNPFAQGDYKAVNIAFPAFQCWKCVEPTTEEVKFSYAEKDGLFNAVGFDCAHLKTFNTSGKCAPLKDVILPPVPEITPAFFPALKEYKKVTIIDLSQQILKNITWKDVLGALKGLTQLRSLDLSYNGFNTSVVKNVSDCLSSLKQLNCLKIQGQLFQGQELVLLYKSLEIFTSLEDLCIDNIPTISPNKRWLWNNENDVTKRKADIELSASNIQKLSGLQTLELYQRKDEDSQELKGKIESFNPKLQICLKKREENRVPLQGVSYGTWVVGGVGGVGLLAVGLYFGGGEKLISQIK